MSESRNDVIIIGAPRSGTNMLRDVLVGLPGFATWPCDEINLMWRHGNRDFPSDELTAAHARPAVRRYLDRQFTKIAKKYNATSVVEKTCAASLRVEFTAAVFPEAKFLFITRDGIDAAASAIDRWNAPLDLRYTAAKTKYVPPSDLPYYGVRFAKNQLVKRRTPREGVTTWWGPKPHDYRELMTKHPLDEICAIQWQRCVDVAQRGFETVPADQQMHISYESYVRDPIPQTAQIADFLGIRGGDLAAATSHVSSASIGKGRSKLGEERVARIEGVVGSTLREFGYAG